MPWLLRQKIAIPDRVEGHVHRAELVDRAMPTRRPLTILKASGGFGKTTLLAECCRGLRREGVATAWVSLDEQDEPEVLDTYIAFACYGAGLDRLDTSNPEASSVELESRVAAVVREIQTFGRPFVIAFDELERLRNPASVSLLEYLLQRGPPNLHLAIACRQIPDGLNVASAVLEGRAGVVETKDLRFSKADVAKFFDLGLSRTELAAEMDRSAGWPLALRISRNRKEREVERDFGVVQNFVGNWIESSLFADIGRDDRDFLLDLGLFVWIDAALLDEVLQRSDSLHRLESMGVLAGLLEPVSGGATESWRLHPLVREHCAKQRFRETPERFRAIHRRIAGALSRRGETVPAMRHAVQGDDSFLAGEILERAGGIRLWTRQGVAQLRAAEQLLSEDVLSTRPRLALVRCMVLVLTGRLEEARKLYRELSASHPARHRDEDHADFEYLVDDCIVRGGMGLYGGVSLASEWMRTLSSDVVRLVRSRRLDPMTRGHMEYALSVLHHLKGEFDFALERLAAARTYLAGSQYIELYGGLLEGQVAMAQGRARDAESHFRRSRRIARKSFALDPVPEVSCKVALKELALECNRVSAATELRGVPGALMAHGAPFSLFATASGLLIELRLRAGRVDRALTAADELLTHLRSTGLASLARYVAALRVSVLVIAGQADNAERAWRLADLPEDAEGCVDLAGQTWREMEAISCARLRWLIASGRFEEGRGLARKLSAAAVERRLRRTRMRTLALSIVLEQRAGERESAAGHLKEFLSLFAKSPYAWPLVREGAACAAVVKRYLGLNPDSPCRESARSLLAAMRQTDDSRGPLLSEREREVLRLLEGRQDKQIAAALGLTTHGVRYHLRKLFTKLGAAKRADAVRRARELGLIPGDS